MMMQQQEFINCLTSYQSMSEMLKTCEYGEILNMVAGLTGSTPEAVERYPVEYCEGMVVGAYRSVLQDLQRNIAQYDWLYGRLSDDISRMVLTNLIGYRIFPATLFLEAARDAALQQTAQEDIQSAGYGENCDAVGEDVGEYEEIKGKDSRRLAFLRERQHIRDNAPKLAVCLHCNVEDMWEIPKLIDTIQSDYKFSIRFHLSGSKGEVVLYALPQERKQKRAGKMVKRIVAIAIGGGWGNVHLVKDCGAISYLFHKNYFCDVSMVGTKQDDDYPNLKYVQGLKLEPLDGTLQSRINYLNEEADKIDGMLLYGAYTEYQPLVDVYKRRNPGGKIYLALDANSSWAEWIQWAAPEFRRFLDECDVIAASGRVMQRHLNEKWPWVIEYIPNGFYNFTGTDMSFSYEKKGNVILTVGRLGTVQKNTEMLLEAFASIADQIPDWSLHLAGTMEQGWEDDYLSRFWERFPELKVRISFLGHLSDKESLYREYLGAKVFALSSNCEGGNANVISEALSAGDAIAITKIDEYRDAIDGGNCGLAAECGDVKGFADILLQLCQRDDLEKMCRRAHEYAKENFDMERIVDRLYYMLFGED